jgi:hypothetical protein
VERRVRAARPADPVVLKHIYLPYDGRGDPPGRYQSPGSPVVLVIYDPAGPHPAGEGSPWRCDPG